MRRRCLNPKHPKFHHYGGRGIRVCERWNTFANFLADMGEKPAGMSIDRINNDGDYEPSNCCWATQKEQMRNRRGVNRVTIEGTTYLAIDLAERAGLDPRTIVKRARTCSTLAEVLSPEKKVDKTGLALGGTANGQRQKAKTHCPKGHEYSGHNLIIRPEGWRTCRICLYAKMKRRLERKKREAAQT